MESEIIDITDNYLENTRYKLVDLAIKGEKKKQIVEMFLDSEEPVSLDDLAVISRDLNKLISEKDINSFISKLIVSSPGVDKPFKYYWQLPKHIGRTLGIVLNDGNTIEARLDSVSNDGVLTLYKYPDKKNKNEKKSSQKETGEEIKIKFTDIKESKVIIKF